MLPFPCMFSEQHQITFYNLANIYTISQQMEYERDPSAPSNPNQMIRSKFSAQEMDLIICSWYFGCPDEIQLWYVPLFEAWPCQ